MRLTRKFVFLSIIVLLIFSFSGCGQKAGEERMTIGVVMPTRSMQRWIQDGDYIKLELEKKGFIVDLQYSEDSVDTQISQLENMITKGVKGLVIVPVDGESLTIICEKAHEEGIFVIAYDRLIKKTPYVDYHVSFDNFIIGQEMSRTLVDALQLDSTSPQNPKYMELFGGSSDDNNAFFVYDGSIDILQPYIDSGVLVIGSGQIGMDRVATPQWSGANAQARMDNLLSAYYTNRRVDAVLSPYDGISIGIISSLKGVGYGSGGLPMPFVGGQDAELTTIKSILADEQYATIFKDTRTLAAKTVDMVTALLEGRAAEVNNTTDYDNGSIIVPCYLLPVTPVYKSNIRSVLVDSGYYTAAELGL